MCVLGSGRGHGGVASGLVDLASKENSACVQEGGIRPQASAQLQRVLQSQIGFYFFESSYIHLINEMEAETRQYLPVGLCRTRKRKGLSTMTQGGEDRANKMATTRRTEKVESSVIHLLLGL